MTLFCTVVFSLGHYIFPTRKLQYPFEETVWNSTIEQQKDKRHDQL